MRIPFLFIPLRAFLEILFIDLVSDISHLESNYGKIVVHVFTSCMEEFTSSSSSSSRNVLDSRANVDVVFIC